MFSTFCRATLLLAMLTLAGRATVITSTSGTCSSPPSAPIAAASAQMGATSASATTDLDCIFGGENTGYATGVASGLIEGAGIADLAVEGEASADTGFVLVPGRETAAQGALADLTVSLHLLVTGGEANGLLRATALQCEMLAGVFGEFRVNGSAEQNLSGCGPGTEVIAAYTRDVPFEISWFIHAEAMSTQAMQADDVGRFRFESFALLTSGGDRNPDASLALLDVPEPSSLLLFVMGTLLVASRRRGRLSHRLSSQNSPPAAGRLEQATSGTGPATWR